MRNYITPETQLVMCVVPTNKKDRYDAIKKFTCVDHPGLYSKIFYQRLTSGVGETMYILYFVI